jgi:hypothetical protein
MFNKNVTQVLSEINGITNSLIVKYPITVAVSESQDMMIHVNISKLDTDSFEEFGIKDSLGDFLSLFKLFGDERTVQIDGNSINVSDKNVASSYIVDNVTLMDAYNKDPEQFTKTESVPTVGSFVLTPDDIKTIKSGAGVFKDLSEVVFTSRDGDISVALAATNKFNAKSNTFSVTKEAETSKEFEVKIPVDNFKMLPVAEYRVDIKYNSARDSYRILMHSKTLEDFKVLLTVKV